jgi:hypothetical protein
MKAYFRLTEFAEQFSGGHLWSLMSIKTLVLYTNLECGEDHSVRVVQIRGEEDSAKPE